jgi:hypothetical protein
LENPDDDKNKDDDKQKMDQTAYGIDYGTGKPEDENDYDEEF